MSRNEDVVYLHPSCCAICGTLGNAQELYPANFALDAFNPSVFSARRLPDRIHYRMVRCKTCGLVRSDPVADIETMRRLYTRSTFDYGEELAGLQKTYGRYLKQLGMYNAKKESLLEIGSGNGFFLQVAVNQGYTNVWGVEPSTDAVQHADPHIRPHLVCDIMRPGLFAPSTFDVICLFQVFDHISDPAALLDECYTVLRSGGVILCLNHNIESFSARLMGEKSPIVDIEHTYLYSPKTMRHLFTMHSFQVRHVGPVINVYSLSYLAHLMPLTEGLKNTILSTLARYPLGQIHLSVPLGNMVLYGQKQ